MMGPCLRRSHVTRHYICTIDGGRNSTGHPGQHQIWWKEFTGHWAVLVGGFALARAGFIA